VDEAGAPGVDGAGEAGRSGVVVLVAAGEGAAIEFLMDVKRFGLS
jgi:hypothetical protein